MARKAAQPAREGLRDFYALGRRVLRVGSHSVNPRTGRLARGSFARICENLGRNGNELSKARRFARLYTPAQVEELYLLGKEEGQQPLTKSHVCRLVVVSSRSLRNKLAKECAKHAWSVQRLQLEIRRIQTKRTYGGRTPKPPETYDEMLGETERLAVRLIRWIDVLHEAADVDRQKHPTNIRPTQSERRAITLKKLPKRRRVQLAAISEEIEELSEYLRKRLDSRSKVRNKRDKRH